MKILSSLILIVAMTTISAGLRASEVSDNFAKWLPDMSAADLNVRKEAQQNWQDLCRSCGADPALRKEVVGLMVDQIVKDNPVETTVWLLRQLGITGNDATVPMIAAFLDSKDPRIADEAARALANIPGKESLAALKLSKSAFAKAGVVAHELDRKKIGDEKTMPLAIPYAEDAAVSAWMKYYGKLGTFEKAQALANLTIRGDKQYLPMALEAVKSDDETLRNAGIFAIGALGGVNDVPVLLDLAFDGDSRDQAKLVLTRMAGDVFDDELIKRFTAEKNADRFETLGDILAKRYNVSIRPILLERAKEADCPNRLALIRIAESLSSKENAGDFVDVWEKITDRGQRDQAEQIIARLVDGDSAPVVAKRNSDNFTAMYSLLGRIGDEKTLKEIHACVFEKKLGDGMNASPDFVAAALRAMCNWPDGRVADDLLAIAENKEFSEADRIQALRGFARVASLPNDRIRIKIDDKGKVAMLAKGMALATRIDEKRLIVQRVGQVRCLESLAFVLQYFDDKDLQNDVCRSIVDLAHHNDLRRRDKEAFTAALDKVIATSKDQGLLDRAKRYKDSM